MAIFRLLIGGWSDHDVLWLRLAQRRFETGENGGGIDPWESTDAVVGQIWGEICHPREIPHLIDQLESNQNPVAERVEPSRVHLCGNEL
jgi:hypothetical protein